MIDVQFVVIAEVRNTIVGDDVRRLRGDVGKAIQRITTSDKLGAGGGVAGRRMPFLLLEVDSSEELMELLGSEMIGNMKCEIHPVVSFETLGKFISEHPVQPDAAPRHRGTA